MTTLKTAISAALLALTLVPAPQAEAGIFDGLFGRDRRDRSIEAYPGVGRRLAGLLEEDDITALKFAQRRAWGAPQGERVYWRGASYGSRSRAYGSVYWDREGILSERGERLRCRVFISEISVRGRDESSEFHVCRTRRGFRFVEGQEVIYDGIDRGDFDTANDFGDDSRDHGTSQNYPDNGMIPTTRPTSRPANELDREQPGPSEMGPDFENEENRPQRPARPTTPTRPTRPSPTTPEIKPDTTTPGQKDAYWLAAAPLVNPFVTRLAQSADDQSRVQVVADLYKALQGQERFLSLDQLGKVVAAFQFDKNKANVVKIMRPVTDVRYGSINSVLNKIGSTEMNQRAKDILSK